MALKNTMRVYKIVRYNKRPLVIVDVIPLGLAAGSYVRLLSSEKRWRVVGVEHNVNGVFPDGKVMRGLFLAAGILEMPPVGLDLTLDTN